MAPDQLAPDLAAVAGAALDPSDGTGAVAGSRADDGVDVLIVSLGSTVGLRAADAELAASLRRAGASVALAAATPPRRMRTLALTDLAWAIAARRAAVAGLAAHRPRAVLYSTTTASLLWPRPGAIRFDAPSAGNRPGRHGLWQRPLERRRLSHASLLLPWSAGGLDEALSPSSLARDRALVLPVPVESSGPPAPVRDVAAITYAANPLKKGLDRVLRAWTAVRRPDEELLVAGASPPELNRAGIAVPPEGVRVTGALPPADYRALLRRARVFVCAPRREDYGLAQLEALADGCLLVTTPAPGPYAALPIARSVDPRLVSDDLSAALRIALDDPAPDHSAPAAPALAVFTRATADRIAREDLLPRLLSHSAA